MEQPVCSLLGRMAREPLNMSQGGKQSSMAAMPLLTYLQKRHMFIGYLLDTEIDTIYNDELNHVV